MLNLCYAKKRDVTARPSKNKERKTPAAIPTPPTRCAAAVFYQRAVPAEADPERHDGRV